jgi:hypothetical protein
MRRISTLALGVLLFVQACSSTDKERGAQATPSECMEPESEGARILREFLAGKRRLPAGDSSYLVGRAPGPCAELSVTRPPGFQINYRLLDGAAPDRIPPRFAIGGTECEVLWGQLHLGTPEVRCSLLAADPLDGLYRELRLLAPHTIKTRQISASPHRGGYTIEWHWPGHSCVVADSGDTEVVPEDEARFRSILDWLVGACEADGHTRCR